MAGVFHPIGGYNGVILIRPFAGNNVVEVDNEPNIAIFCSEWSMSLSCQMLPIDAFGRYSDIRNGDFNGYFQRFINGLQTGSASIKGWYNDVKAARPFDLKVIPGEYIQAFFGHSPTTGYLVNAYISDVRPSVSVGGVQSFDWNVQINRFRLWRSGAPVAFGGVNNLNGFGGDGFGGV